MLKWGARKAYINGKGGAQKSKGGTAPLYDALAKALICILASSYSQQMEDTSDSALFIKLNVRVHAIAVHHRILHLYADRALVIYACCH